MYGHIYATGQNKNALVNFNSNVLIINNHLSTDDLYICDVFELNYLLLQTAQLADLKLVQLGLGLGLVQLATFICIMHT